MAERLTVPELPDFPRWKVQDISDDPFNIENIFYSAASSVVQGVSFGKSHPTVDDSSSLTVYVQSPRELIRLRMLREAVTSDQGVFRILEEASEGRMRSLWSSLDPEGKYNPRKPVVLSDKDLNSCFLLSYERGDWVSRRDLPIIYPQPKSFAEYRDRLVTSGVEKITPERAIELLGRVLKGMSDRLA